MPYLDYQNQKNITATLEQGICILNTYVFHVGNEGTSIGLTSAMIHSIKLSDTLEIHLLSISLPTHNQNDKIQGLVVVQAIHWL